MVFCNIDTLLADSDITKVTILILIDGFLQYLLSKYLIKELNRHNPYFNRWFSAIMTVEKEKPAIRLSQSLF